MSLPIIAIVLVYSLIVFVRPFFGIILFILLLQIINASSLFVNAPISNIISFATQVNKYIIIVLVLRSLLLLTNRQPVNRISNDKTERLFIILIASFTVWSSISILWADAQYSSVVSFELRRLLSFIIMMGVIYLNVNSRKELIIVMLMGLFLSFLRLIASAIIFLQYSDRLHITGSAGLIIFSLLYLFRKKKLHYKISGIIFTISSFAAGILAASRRGFIEIILPVLITIFGNYSRKTFYYIIVLTAALYFSISVFSTEYFYYRVKQTQSALKGFNSSWSGRESIWIYAWEAALDKPIIGHGFGSNIEIIRVYGHREFGARAHNSYLKVWVELGILGLVLLISIFITHTIILYGQIKRIRLFKDNLLYSLIFARFAVWISTIIVAFFGYSAYLHKSMWFTFCFTLITSKIINTYPVKKTITVKQ